MIGVVVLPAVSQAAQGQPATTAVGLEPGSGPPGGEGLEGEGRDQRSNPHPSFSLKSAFPLEAGPDEPALPVFPAADDRLALPPAVREPEWDNEHPIEARHYDKQFADLREAAEIGLNAPGGVTDRTSEERGEGSSLPALPAPKAKRPRGRAKKETP